MNWYPWLVLAHVVGAFGFALAHGTSVMTAFRLRRERDPQRIAALLDLSSFSLGLLYASLLVLLAAGIAAGIAGGHFGRIWIWAAIGILVLIAGGMYPLGSSYFNGVRRAVGMRVYGDKADAPLPTPVSPDELAAIVSTGQPVALALVGGVGLLAILWLMVLKPF